MKELSLEEERALFYGALGSATFVNPAEPRTVQGVGNWIYTQHPDGRILIKNTTTGATSWANTAQRTAIEGEIGKYPAAAAADETQKGKKTWDFFKQLAEVLPGVIKPRSQPTTTLPTVVVPPTPEKASPWGTVAIVGGIVVVLGVGIWGITRLTRKD